MTDSLYGRLKELANSDFYPFHMPGHKRNVQDGAMPAWYSADITEIEGFDNLHQPHGILLHSQQKAAGLYQADRTYFLINGSTAGILSAVSAAAVSGKKMLVARNSHLSVYHGAYLNDFSLKYLYPRLDGKYGMAAGFRREDVAAALRAEGDIGAVLITSPTYEGVVSDVRGIAAAAHEYGIPLIVDQAHGAHFGFHPDYPENAVSQGADLVIHSLHKTLPAPTQTALLHLKGERIDAERLERYLRIFQSSSPSYPLMGGIDLCLDLLYDRGREMMGDLLRLRREFAEKIKHLKYLRLFGETDDPAKMVITVSGKLPMAVLTPDLEEESEPPDISGIPTHESEESPDFRWETALNGYRLAEILRNKYHLEMEMAAEGYIVAIITPMDRPEGFNHLAHALDEIDAAIVREAAFAPESTTIREAAYPSEETSARKTALSEEEGSIKKNDTIVTCKPEAVKGRRNESNESFLYHPHPLETVMNIKAAWEQAGEEATLAEAVGRIAAGFIFLYPPGIPLAVPGERLDGRILTMIADCLRAGIPVHGLTAAGKLKLLAEHPGKPSMV